MPRPTRARYRVVAFAVTLAFITYIDRACIGQTAPAIRKDLQLGIAKNLKRLAAWDVDWADNASAQSPYLIAKTLEMKTAWHPMGV